MRIFVWDLYVTMREDRYAIGPEGIFEWRRLERS